MRYYIPKEFVDLDFPVMLSYNKYVRNRKTEKRKNQKAKRNRRNKGV